MNADAMAQGVLARSFARRVPGVEPRTHLARRGDGGFGMLRVVHRCAENGLDLVADELQHQPAMGADRGVHLGEVGIQVGQHLRVPR